MTNILNGNSTQNLIIGYDSPREIKIGDVFYTITLKSGIYGYSFRRTCKLCKDKHEVVINDKTYDCPSCSGRSDPKIIYMTRYGIKRWFVNSIKIDSDDIYFNLIRETKDFHFEKKTICSSLLKSSYNLSFEEYDKILSTNSQDFDYSLNQLFKNIVYDNYKLACEVADKLNQKGEDIVKKLSKEDNVNYRIPKRPKYDKEDEKRAN